MDRSRGNRLQMTSRLAPVPAGTFLYNANDQLQTDAYDANGNTTSSGGLNYAYDFENHLVQQGGISIVYDGDGNRVSKTVAGVTTKYWVDVNNPTGYAQVLQEIPPNNFPVQYYYGLELLERYDTNNGRAVRYYVYDGHGSVRALTDSSGNVTDTYDGVYPGSVGDAFGNEIHSTGTSPNNYLFAGEQYDPDLNLYYNRARYLNTNTGRFWTMDTEEGAHTDPLSLHKYTYAEADPVNGIDLSGNDDTLAETASSLSIAQTVAAASVVSLTGVCAALATAVHGPGFCGSKNEPLILYRGLSGRNPGQIKPEYFTGDGLSLYEKLYPGRYKFKLPFVIDYLEPKTPGTMAENIYVPPFLDEIADITYTPEIEDPSIGEGHWSLQLKLGIALTADVLRLLISYMKDAALPF